MSYFISEKRIWTILHLTMYWHGALKNTCSLKVERNAFQHTHTHTVFMPNHCCRYWNTENKWKGSEFATFFWTPLWQKEEEKKKTWAISVDSTILVNGYHIYSTACYYNSSVSNLDLTCSQVFLRLPIFRHLSARPQSVSGEHAGRHAGRGPSSPV